MNEPIAVRRRQKAHAIQYTGKNIDAVREFLNPLGWTADSEIPGGHLMLIGRGVESCLVGEWILVEHYREPRNQTDIDMWDDASFKETFIADTGFCH